MENLLPIGSVVKLKNGTKNLMVIGTHQRNADKKVYDYVGVVHPEGYINSEIFFLFNQTDVDAIEFIGCINAEVQAYRQIIAEEQEKEKKGTKSKSNSKKTHSKKTSTSKK